MNRPSLLHYAIALGCALVVSVPFLDKPFTIDDPVVVEVAEQILKDPLRPYSGEITWMRDRVPVFKSTTNPPLLSYCLSPILGIFGHSEIALHLGMLPFFVMLALAMAVLAFRFAAGRLWPLFFVMASPAVVVSSNLMRDVPGTALMVAAVACFVLGCDRDRKRLMALGAFWAGCAILTKYSHMVAFLILGSYALLYRKPKALVWLLIPVAMIAAWFAQNVWAHGEVHLAYMAREYRGTENYDWLDKLRGGATVVGALLWLWPVAIVHDLRNLKWWRLSLAALFSLAGVVEAYRYETAMEFRLGPDFYFWLVTGIVLLVWVLCAALERIWRDSRTTVSQPTEEEPPQEESAQDEEPFESNRGRDVLFLLIWVGCHLGIALFGVGFQAVRHILPLFPALTLLVVLVLHAEGSMKSGWLVRTLLGVTLAIQLLLAAFLGVADYEYANTARKYVREELPKLAEQARQEGLTIQYRGSWGWRIYARQAGLTNIAHNDPVPPGDSVLVYPRHAYKNDFPEGFDESRLTLVEEHAYSAKIPLRTTRSWAGFYAVVHNTAPFRYAEDELDVFEVYYVEPPWEDEDG